MSTALAPAPNDLGTWPATARHGWIVEEEPGGERRRITLHDDGCLEIDGAGTFMVVAEARVAERRAGLAAFAAGRI